MRCRLGWSVGRWFSRGPAMLSGSDTVVIRRVGDRRRAIPFCVGRCPVAFRSRCAVDPRVVLDRCRCFPLVIPSCTTIGLASVASRCRSPREDRNVARSGLLPRFDRDGTSGGSAARANDTAAAWVVRRHLDRPTDRTLADVLPPRRPGGRHRRRGGSCVAG